MRRAACAVAIAGCVVLAVWIRTRPLALHESAVRAEIAARAAVRESLAGDVVREVPPDERAKALDGRVATWIAEHPDEFAASRDALAERFRDYLRYRGEDGREHAYLGGADSYTWLRSARNQLRHGSSCDTVVDGQCRDLLASAPVGARMKYGRSLHVSAIAAVHRVLSRLRPGYPLPASAFWVQVIAGALGVLPAFLLGRRLGGVLGGLTSALIISLQPMLLIRSLGGDNDVWNVILPCTVLWALIEAYASRRRGVQLGFAALAAIAAGVHAANWRGWVMELAVVLVSTMIALLLRSAAEAPGGGGAIRPRRGRVSQTLAIGLLFVFGSGILSQFIAVEGGEIIRFAKLAAKVLPQPPAPQAPAHLSFPRMARTVSELQRPSMGRTADALGGVGVALAVALGAGVLLIGGRTRRHLPDTREQREGEAPPSPVGDGGSPGSSPSPFSGHSSGVPLESRVLILVWLAAAAYLTATGLRFAILLGPPAGACAAALIGALQRRARRAGVVVAVAMVVALAGLLVSQARAIASGYIPAMTDAWWDTFTSIRDQSPPDAIVNVWWDYGYWAKYVAERGVSADGGTLGTRAPFWLAHALIAPTAVESAGVLRMLNCGNDASPTPEGALGARAKLTALLGDETRAYQLLRELMLLDRDEARQRLGAMGLDATTQSDVLASTHCDPPATFVVVTDEQLADPDALLHLGTWNPTTSTSLARELAKIPPISAPHARNSAWLQCARRGGHIVCPVGSVVGDSVLDAFVYDPNDPRSGVFSFRRIESGSPTRKRETAAPGVVLLLDDTDEGAVREEATFADVGVLVDPARERILVGLPVLLRSTLVKLILLDGRGAPQFEKVGERTAGYRVLTYRLRW